jgi:hypothetical protein
VVENVNLALTQANILVTVQEIECKCQVSAVYWTTSYLMCTLPKITYNSSLATVRVMLGSVAYARVLPVQNRIMSLGGIIVSQQNFGIKSNQITQLALYTSDITKFVNDKLQFSEIFTASTDTISGVIYFEILNPGKVFLTGQDFSLIFTINPRSVCKSPFPISCSSFLSSSFGLTNVTIAVSTVYTLIAYGNLRISNCPSLFCGQAGRGLFFDLGFSAKNGTGVQKSSVIGVMPPYSQLAISVQPSIVPSGRPFSVSIIIQRLYATQITTDVRCELWDNSSRFYDCNVLQVLQQRDGLHAEVTLRIASVPAGLFFGRIFSQKSTSLREVTLSLFNASALNDLFDVQDVDWISASQGKFDGGMSVQAKLTGFPIMISRTEVSKILPYPILFVCIFV